MTVQPLQFNDPLGRSAGEVESTTPTTLLVVDDAAVDRRMAGALVERALGWRVVYADNGRTALAAIDREMPAD